MSLLIPIHGEPITSGPASYVDWISRRLKVIVVFTSIEGTIAALTAAATHAKALSAQIVICVPHVVSFRYPLERPPVSRDYFEKLSLAVIAEAALDPIDMKIEVYSCRSPLSCLKERLKPHSLVVLGTVRAWRSRREKRLASALGKLGHDVVLVHVPRDAERVCSLSVVQRMLLYEDECRWTL